MAEKLRPCPFCGGEAHIDSDYSSELDHTFWQVWHDCSTNPGPIRHTYGHALGMEISTPWCASEDAAVDLWNRRAGTTCELRCESRGGGRMISDTERREAARRLREIKPCKSGHIKWWEIARALGLKQPAGWFGWEKFEPDSANHLADLIEPQKITGETSDGYHTFDELYDHRAKLFSVIVRDHRELAWKSRLHHDGTMYDGMFIVGIETPGGQATYHYDIDPYWDLFDCKELDRAPEWDGHTPHQAIDRIAALEPSCDRDALLALADEIEDSDVTYLVSTQYVLDSYASRIREALGVTDG